MQRGKLPKSKLLTTTEVRNKMIAKENKKILKEIVSTQSNYSTAELLRDWKRIEDTMEYTAR